jgi:ABC-type multidrug transport system fused ATPase/permease subunit
MEGKTSVVIAHRLSTIRKAICIYVVDGGQIVESGSHDELLQQEDGVYRKLHDIQFQDQEAPAALGA